MLISIFVTFAAITLNLLSTPLPEGRLLPSNFPDMLQDVFDAMWGFDWIFPTGTLISVILIGIGLVIVEKIIHRMGRVLSFFKR